MNHIRDVRKQKGMTQNELAAKLGINRATLSKYENGQIDPTISQLEEISEFLDVSLYDLIPAEKHKSIKDGFELGYMEREAEFHDEVDFACNELERRKEDVQYFRLLLSYENLNTEGQKMVVEYAEALETSPKFKTAKLVNPIPLRGKDGWFTTSTTVQEWQGKKGFSSDESTDK